MLPEFDKDELKGALAMGKLTKPVLILLVPILCCLAGLVGCSMLIAKDTVETYLYHLEEERVYKEKLGIGTNDSELEAFMTQELKGLTHEEALARLGQWGIVRIKDCKVGPVTGRCVVEVSGFLGTRSSEVFTIFYRNLKVDSVAIEYS